MTDFIENKKNTHEWKVCRATGCAAALTCDPAQREGARGGFGVTQSSIQTWGGGVGDWWRSRGRGERCDVVMGAPPHRRLVVAVPELGVGVVGGRGAPPPPPKIEEIRAAAGSVVRW
jgi:hypothetical protein